MYIKIKELALHLKNSTQPYCQRPPCIWHLWQAKPWLKGASLDCPEALRICYNLLTYTPPPFSFRFRTCCFNRRCGNLSKLACFEVLTCSKTLKRSKTSETCTTSWGKVSRTLSPCICLGFRLFPARLHNVLDTFTNFARSTVLNVTAFAAGSPSLSGLKCCWFQRVMHHLVGPQYVKTL